MTPKQTKILIWDDNQEGYYCKINGNGEELLLLLCNTYHSHNEFYELIKTSIELYDDNENTLSTTKI